MMRKHQATAEALRARAEALPRRYATLHAAAIELSMCVSCKPTAVEQCDLARESMELMK